MVDWLIKLLGGYTKSDYTDLDLMIDRSIKTAYSPNVTSVGDWAFYNCERLESVSFPNAVTVDMEYLIVATL